MLDRAPAAVVAARKATNYERRNVDAWEVLLAAQAATGADAKAREATLREAAFALEAYPDLNAQFRQRIADSLRARGEKSAADNEERQIARKNQESRADLTTAQAATMMKRAMDEQPLAEQLRTYTGIVSQFGRNAGTAFYDDVAKPFINRLVHDGRKPEARTALTQVRTALSPDIGSQLAQEMDKLASTLK